MSVWENLDRRSQNAIKPVPIKSNQVINKLHWFNPNIAKRYGLVEAVIYPYVTALIAINRMDKASPSLSNLKKIYPYLGRDQIWRALENLSAENEEEFYESEKGLPALLHRLRAGNRYVYQLAFQPKKAKVPHSFDPEMATKYGLPAAVLYDDFARWIIGNDLDDRHIAGDTPYHYESARQWASVHGYIPLRTVERCLKTLQDAGELIHAFDPLTGEKYYHIKDGIRSPVWTMPFGVGKVDRWNQLHRAKELASKGKPPINENRDPVLDDGDFPHKKSSFLPPPKPNESPPKPNDNRQNQTVHRQNQTIRPPKSDDL